MDLQIDRVIKCHDWLQTISEKYTAQQSISWYIDILGLLCNSHAFVNEQKAIAKMFLNQKKAKVYETLALSSVANGQYYSPSLAKDYVAARCDKEQFEFDLCDRCGSTLVHTIEAIRSILSALKEEMKVMSYTSG